MEIMGNGTFNSKTAEVKYLILGYMSEQEHSVTRNSIVQYVQEHVSCEVTDGVIAGAIKVLTSTGEIIPTERGIYIKGSGSRVKATSFEKIYNLCKRFESDLVRACTLNILELTEQEKEVYPDFLRNLTDLRTSVQLGTACLGSLLDDIKENEKNSLEDILENPNPEGAVAEGESFVAGQENDEASKENEAEPLINETENKEVVVETSEGEMTEAMTKSGVELEGDEAVEKGAEASMESNDTEIQEKSGRKGKQKK